MSSSEVSRLLAQIARDLRPEPARVKDAEQRALTLIEDLHNKDSAWMFTVLEAVPHGSHARGTAIQGFKDVDYLVVLEPRDLRTSAGRTRSATDTVTRLAAMIRERRAGLVALGTIVVRAQTHSVGVKYPKAGFRVDLVPALRTDERGCFLIPNRVDAEWTETRPSQLKRRVSIAEQRNPNVRDVIRLIKGWRRARGKSMQIPSYAIELMLSAWAAEATTLEGLTRLFFQRFAASSPRSRLVLLGSADTTAVTVRDPGSGKNVTSELTTDHRQRLIENAQRALAALGEAEAMANEGRRAAALTHLRRLFGPTAG